MTSDTDNRNLLQIGFIRDPGPTVFVSSCAVLSLCLIHLMHQTRHHRYQTHILISGVLCGLFVGLLTGERKKTLPAHLLTAYMPAMTILAQVMSLVLHTIFPSWRDSESVPSRQLGSDCIHLHCEHCGAEKGGDLA